MARHGYGDDDPNGCRRHKARLVIAKLDRLSRNLALVATVMEAGVEFVAVDITSY